jgi:hypothetical protein
LSDKNAIKKSERVKRLRKRRVGNVKKKSASSERRRKRERERKRRG